jgi:hypothetical protein
MTQDAAIYLLNSLGWFAAGIVATIAAQRVIEWRHHGRPRLSRYGFTQVMTVGIALVGILFTQAYRVKLDKFIGCQARVDKAFRVTADADRANLYDLYTEVLSNNFDEAKLTAFLNEALLKRAQVDQARKAAKQDCDQP